MEELIAWLGSILDEEERLAQQTAKESGGATWRVGPPKRCECCNSVLSTGGVEIIATDDRMTEHIARYDPAAVLADIAAKRALIDFVEYAWTERSAGHAGVIIQEVVRHLASVYSDQPGYREEWRP